MCSSSINILVSLQLDYVAISDKRRILRSGVSQRMAFIRKWHSSDPWRLIKVTQQWLCLNEIEVLQVCFTNIHGHVLPFYFLFSLLKILSSYTFVIVRNYVPSLRPVVCYPVTFPNLVVFLLLEYRTWKFLKLQTFFLTLKISCAIDGDKP